MGGLGQSHPSVLVVADATEWVELYSSWLADSYNVHTVTTSDAALSALDERIALVVLDWHTLDESASDTLMRLEDQEDIRVVAIVADASSAASEPPFDCDEFLEKPIQRVELIEAVERLLDIRSYDAVQHQLSSLRVRRNVLRMEHQPGTLADDEHFQELTERIDELEAELEAIQSNREPDCPPVGK